MSVQCTEVGIEDIIIQHFDSPEIKTPTYSIYTYVQRNKYACKKGICNLIAVESGQSKRWLSKQTTHFILAVNVHVYQIWSHLIAVYISKQHLVFPLIYVFIAFSNFQAIAVSNLSLPQLSCLLHAPIKMAHITDSSTKANLACARF